MRTWNKVNYFANWTVNILYLNLLWYVFILLGLGIFGLFPSTAAMFAIVRKWIYKKERNFNVFQEFKKYYFDNFIQLNAMAFIYYLGMALLFMIVYMIDVNSQLYIFLFFIFLIVSIPMIASLLYIFPVFVQFRLATLDYIKQSFLIAIASPRELFPMFLSASLWLFLSYLFPGLLIFFHGPTLAIIFIHFSSLTFNEL